MKLISILKKLFNFVKSPQPYYENIVGKLVLYNKEKYKTAARNYFEKKNLIQYFSLGDKTEIQPEYLDLKNLHESSSPTDLYIIVDGRNRNANFLLKNLKLNYKFSRNVGFKRFTIEKL